MARPGRAAGMMVFHGRIRNHPGLHRSCLDHRFGDNPEQEEAGCQETAGPSDRQGTARGALICNKFYSKEREQILVDLEWFYV